MEKYSIPIYENGVKTEYTVDGEIGDEKYLEIIKFGEKGKLPDFINITTAKPEDN
jgi:hypothetical protein